MIKVGRGWRWGFRSHTPPYVALIGGDTWAFELTGAEWEDLLAHLLQIPATIEAIGAELADQESFSFDLDSPWWELAVEGTIEDWQLRLQTRSGRRAEGFLTAAAVLELVKHLGELSPPDSVPDA